MAHDTERPIMTVGKAALVAIVTRYHERAVEVSLIEVQKLMYFLQEAGEELKLRYTKDLYGLYADNLRHVLCAVDGHFLTGYADASQSGHAAEPVAVLPRAAEEAHEVLANHPATEQRIQRVLHLVESFESAYAMELLTAVHWIATKEDPSASEDADTAVRLVGEWSQRQKRMFGPDHVTTAWRRLQDEGWLSSLVRA